jgi:hypothetical protein
MRAGDVSGLATVLRMLDVSIGASGPAKVAGVVISDTFAADVLASRFGSATALRECSGLTVTRGVEAAVVKSLLFLVFGGEEDLEMLEVCL